MDNCEIFGFKHHLKITGAVDHFIVGWVYFECTRCKSKLAVDRPMLYKALITPGRARWR